MSNRHLQMAYEAYYGDKCKAAAHLVGHEIQSVQTKRSSEPCDEYGGDVIVSRASSKFHYPRHDSMKFTLKSLLDEAGVANVCEPDDLFAAYVRQDDGPGLGGRHVLRPDFVTTQGGKRTLWDVKTICMCKSWYKPGATTTAVMVRQNKVNSVYQAAARKADRRTYQDNNDGRAAPQNHRGAVCAELDSYGEVKGLVAGAFGEMSSNVEALVNLIAQTKARQWQLRGAISEEHAKASAKREAVRDIGIEAVRGYAILKDDRIRSITVNMRQSEPDRSCHDASWRAWKRRQLEYYHEHIGNGVEGSSTSHPLGWHRWSSRPPSQHSRAV